MANIQRLLRIGLGLAFNPARIAENAADAARRTAILIICVAVGGLILVPAAGRAAAGLWILVQHNIGPVWAAFVTAAALVIVAVIILLIGLLASRKRPEKNQRRQQAAARQAAASAGAWQAAALSALPAPADMAAAGRGFFTRHKGTALLTAAVVGLVMGQDLIKPGRRRTRG